MLRACLLSILCIGIASAQVREGPGPGPGQGSGPQAPAPIPEFAQLKPVSHGELRVVWYQSKTHGIQRRMHIYLPPGYERSHEKYPVLYLIHGGGQDDSAWPNGGRAGFILDNLLAEGKAKPMIVVMPNGGSVDPTMNLPSNDNTPDALTARIVSSTKARDAFIDDLLTGVIPYIESNYRVRANRDSRAIAGFSFGGAESLWAGTQHTDGFAWIAAFAMGIQGDSKSGPNAVAGSGSADTPDEFVKHNTAFFADSAKTNKRVKLFWIGVGKDDPIVVNGPKQLADTLAAHEIRYEYHEYEGGHSMSNANLHDFASLLFQ